MEYRRAWAEINLSALEKNINIIKNMLPLGTLLLGAVKADAYGHGAAETALTMQKNGVNYLGVALCEEGIELRRANINLPILVMSYTPEPMLKSALEHGLILTVFSADSAFTLAKIADSLNVQAQVHIKIDTGMGRLGFLPTKESAKSIADIFNNKSLNITGIYTHFATSDSLSAGFMYEQHTKYKYILSLLKEQGINTSSLCCHMGNSGALSQTIREGFVPPPDGGFFLDMIRVGIMLYGLPPSSEMRDICKIINLSPIMKLKTRISMTKILPPGSGVSYGHLFRTQRETMVATLPIGYADGYPRTLSNKGNVLINGHKAPIIGAICMDQCMIDVTDVPDNKNLKPGDTVTMFGEPCITADDLADMIGTISYEILCGVGKRVPRIYT